MSGIAIAFVLIVVALGLFVWGRVPAVIVAIGMSLALFFTAILPANQALAGFGDQTVILIASLFVVTAGLEASGVTTWAGQLVIKRAGESCIKLMLLIMLLAALFCATISVNGTVAALLPLCVVVSVRLNVPTSQLLLPMCFATHGSAMLTLIGAPLNVIASNATVDAGLGPIGFFEFAIAGVPMFLGTIAITLLTRIWLLPHKNGGSLPPDLSQHARRSSSSTGSRTDCIACACGPPRPMSAQPGTRPRSRSTRGFPSSRLRAARAASRWSGRISPRETSCWSAATRKPQGGSPPTRISPSIGTRAPAGSPKRCSIAARAGGSRDPATLEAGGRDRVPRHRRARR
jgi:hypothetical protein